MIIFPAIDLLGGKAVRLLKGDYNKVTVYSDNPLDTALSFKNAGAEYLHVVDLDGARDGDMVNFDTIATLAASSGLKLEVGGGIRSMDAIEKYIDVGVFRVILGTAAITMPGFVEAAVKSFGDKIAVGVDIKDERVAIKGWTEVVDKDAFDFGREMEALGVKTIICTDISKDGVLGGTNLALYRMLSEVLSLDIIASGGVSTLDDIRELKPLGTYGAIIGKALYTGGISLADAIEISKG